jgi:hypothetical protein
MADDDGENGGPKNYEVGYGKPPKHTRFRKGQSGNPRGPKKGSRALKTDLDEALRATLTINVGGKKRRGTTQALSMYALAIKAATGDLRASKLLADLVMAVFGPGDRGGGETRLSKHDQELLDRLLERLEPDEAKEDEGAPSSELDPGGDGGETRHDA